MAARIIFFFFVYSIFQYVSVYGYALTPKPNLPYPDVALFSTGNVSCDTSHTGSSIVSLTDSRLLPYYEQYDIAIGSYTGLTRWAFLSLVLNFAWVNEESEKSDLGTRYYPDVFQYTAYRSSIHYATRHGIVSGDTNGRFYPQRLLTRAEAAKILIHALGLSWSTESGSFIDVPSTHSLTPFIEELASRCIIHGKGVSSQKNTTLSWRIFGPEDPITGPETLKILYNFSLGMNGGTWNTQTLTHSGVVPVMVSGWGGWGGWGGVITPVKDTTPPIVSLSGSSPFTLTAWTVFTDPGASWTDDRDGSWNTLTGTYGSTGSFTRSGSVNPLAIGTYFLEYRKVDMAGNMSSRLRTVLVNPVPDTTPPIVSLSGATTLALTVWGAFTDPGASWTDDRDGSWNTLTGTHGSTGSFTVSGAVNVSMTGTYVLIYKKVDTSWNSGSAVRTVTVLPDTVPPNAPPQLLAQGNSTTSIKLWWMASTDTGGVVRYDIRRCEGLTCTNHTLLSTSSGVEYLDTGFIPSANPKVYRYFIRACDTSNNCSGYINSTANPFPTIPAFYRAQGAGATSVWGRWGTICRVTNLANRGTGTLRFCIEQSWPRIVVFDVWGIISLTAWLVISNPYITIAWQTAPGWGITIAGTGTVDNILRIQTHNVTIQWLRMRKWVQANFQGPTQDGDEIAIVGLAHDVIVDHCSMSWTTDENISVWWTSYGLQPSNLTYSWNMVYEPIKAHPTNFLLWSDLNASDTQKDIDSHHNLFANSSHRNPLIKVKEFRFINNIVYNWAIYATQIGWWWKVDVINNYYKTWSLYMTWRNPNAYEVTVYPEWNLTTPFGDPSIFISGNIGMHNSDPNSDNWNMVRRVTGENGWEIWVLSSVYQRFTPLPPSLFPIIPDPAITLENTVISTVWASQGLNCSGTVVNTRDSIDTRIITEYFSGTGTIPQNESDVGWFTTINPGTPCLDGDNDGIPNLAETRVGMDPSNPTDASLIGPSGYSRIEEFLAGML